MEKSFKKQKNNEKESTPDADAAMLADIEGTSTAVATYQSSMPAIPIGGVSGDVEAEDLVFPYMKIVYGTSAAAEDFPMGCFLLNNDTMVTEKGVPMYFTPLALRKYYEEWLDFDPNGPRPQVFNSKKELVDAGLWTDWRNDTRPPARDVADLMMLIEQPEGIESTAFSTPLGDKKYALAQWKLAGSCYKGVAKPIFSKLAIELRELGLLGGRFSVHTEIRKIGGNNVPCPVLGLAGFNSPELIAEIKTTFGGAAI